ncbi:hypothetical protein IGJ63_000804 [Enterococcus sp. DIV1375a]|uniref:hypothetical protein n=1 Tax=Enterococcus sp. DIV1375a TaxID=2774755 RepID=UPI003F25576B
MSVKEELANVIEKMVEEQVSEQMRIIEEKYFAKSKQTRFTQAELAEKWGCSKGYVWIDVNKVDTKREDT